MEKRESSSPETESECIPTLEEVRSVLQELIGDKQYKETRRCEDEKGLYLLEAVVPGEKGEWAEYIYMREGCYTEGQTLSTTIHIAYYENEIPVGGTSLAKYIDGKWKIL